MRWHAMIMGVVAFSALLLPSTREASAQVPGSISGIVRPGRGSDAPSAGVLVQLIELRQGPQVVQETRTIAGRFRFEIQQIDPAVSYLTRAVVENVGYLPASPVQLSAQRPAAQVDILVYASTPDRPSLRASVSATTIVNVDRAAGTITLQREDAVVNPSTGTWTGDTDGVTLRLPRPVGTIAAEGQAWYGSLPTTGDLTDGPDGLVVRVPFRPGETMLITRYTVQAEVAAPRYELRNEAALPTDQLQVMVPERFASAVAPLGDALAAEPIVVEGQRLLVVERSRPGEEGDAVAASVSGLAAPIRPHPFTVLGGATAGAMLVLLMTGAAALLAVRRAGPAEVLA